LAAQYAANIGAGWMPCIDDTATTDPPPVRTMRLPACFITRYADVMFRRSVSSRVSTL
jgi:hypothetical protein